MTSLRRVGAALAGLALVVLASGAQARIVVESIPGLEFSGSLFNYGNFRWQGKSNHPSYFNLVNNDGSQLSGRLFAPVRGQAPGVGQYANVNAFRTQLSLETVYTNIPHFTPVVKIRPFYDAMFSWEQKPFGPDPTSAISPSATFPADGSGPGGFVAPMGVGRYWESNFLNGNLSDKYDPLVREAYVDVNFFPFFLRAGRQIITWGKADGVLVLDKVNPNNFRDPLIFEQERFRIPIWALNVNYDFGRIKWLPGIQKELQVIWNMQYIPSRFAGFNAQETSLHPWELAVVAQANQVVWAGRSLFGDAAYLDNYAYNKGKSFFENTELFIRWAGRIGEGLGEPLKELTYSLNFGHLYYRVPIYLLQGSRVDAGFEINFACPRGGIPGVCDTGGIDFTTRRYQFFGGAFDKQMLFKWMPGWAKGTVIRGEAVYNFGFNAYDPSVQNVRTDTTTYMLGFDQYLYLSPKGPLSLWPFKVPTPWFTSFQVWQDWILRGDSQGRFTNVTGAACANNRAVGGRCGRRGWGDIGSWNLFNGLRKQHRTIVTLFMFNDLLPGKTLHLELFGLHEFEQTGTWLRALVGYNFRTNFGVRMGINSLWGPRSTVFGQFKDNTHIFTEVKYTF